MSPCFSKPLLLQATSRPSTGQSQSKWRRLCKPLSQPSRGRKLWPTKSRCWGEFTMLPRYAGGSCMACVVIGCRGGGRVSYGVVYFNGRSRGGWGTFVVGVGWLVRGLSPANKKFGKFYEWAGGRQTLCISGSDNWPCAHYGSISNFPCTRSTGGRKRQRPQRTLPNPGCGDV